MESTAVSGVCQRTLAAVDTTRVEVMGASSVWLAGLGITVMNRSQGARQTAASIKVTHRYRNLHLGLKKNQ